MDVANFDLVPGIIIDVNDPMKLGRIKCSAQGLFDPNTMDEDVLPWIMPIKMNKYQMFSKQEKNRKVWILNNKNNPNEYWYFTHFEMIKITDDLVKEKYDNDIEVVVSRPTAALSAQFSYDNKDGFIIHYDDWKWNMTPDGKVTCHGDQGDIDIREQHVFAGRNSEEPLYEPSTLCNSLRTVFQQLQFDFAMLKAAASQEDPLLVPGFTSAEMHCMNAANGTSPTTPKSVGEGNAVNAQGFCAKNVSIN